MQRMNQSRKSKRTGYRKLNQKSRTKSRTKSKTKSRTKSRRYLGGASHLGTADSGNQLLDDIANEWYYEWGRQCWWSDNQDGYYFSNLENNFMSPTHTHIYDAKYTPNGSIEISYSRKVEYEDGSGSGSIFRGMFTGNNIDHVLEQLDNLNRIFDEAHYNDF